MPSGSTASLADTAPSESPAEVTGLAFAPGDLLWFSATGTTDHCSFGSCGFAGPEGDFGEGIFEHRTRAENGIADLLAPIDSLVGVFLDTTQPDLSAAPEYLDFSSASARDFATLSPLLKQPFYIGDGLRNDGTTMQSFEVPVGATRLYLGTMDGWGWYDNSGVLSVTVAVQGVPEPATVVLLGIALAGLGFSRRRKLH